MGKTRLQNLVRHKSGRYYARAFAGGKEVWKSLKTSHFSVAQARLAEFLKEHRRRVSNGNGEVSAKMTFGQSAEIHLRNLDENLSIKPRTRHYWLQRLAALIKSWPGLNETEIRQSDAILENVILVNLRLSPLELELLMLGFGTQPVVNRGWANRHCLVGYIEDYHKIKALRPLPSSMATNCIADCIWPAIPQATERQRLGN